MDKAVPFSVLVDMLEDVIRTRKPALKKKYIQTFLIHHYRDHEYFSAMRLILPELDKERGTYGMKEGVLARFIAEAFDLSKESADFIKLTEWRRGGKATGKNAGNFPLVVAEVLSKRQREISAGISIHDVNDLLDRLAAAGDSKSKATGLRELIAKTNVREMKWIVMIILKDLKLGMSETTILREYHPDAVDLFNVTCDLKGVCSKLTDRSQRYKRQDIEPGKPVRPQLAKRVSSAEEAWKKMKGKEVVAECKFDGDRIQIHKNGTDVHFFSRTFKDHAEFTDAMRQVVLDSIIHDKCILDGEMTVWDDNAKRFVEFGSNQSYARAAQEGVESHGQLCYIAFDILYYKDSSVIHRPLRERQELLLEAVRPAKGRFEVLNPRDGLNSTHREPDDPMWAIYASSLQELQRFFFDTVENREEGIMIKDLDSKWDPGDRGDKWLKLKPDYVNANCDLDVLIIGGYFGSGRRGGEVSQWLLGIAEKPKGGGNPTSFVTFCRVGTGLKDDEAADLRDKLRPLFKYNERGMKPPPWIRASGNSKERPDVWITCPEKSVVVQVKADIRSIKTEVFAAPYCLRFPRIERIRHDKPWYDVLDDETLVQIVTEGTANSAPAYEGMPGKHRAKKRAPPVGPALSLLPAHLVVTDVSQVERNSQLFKGLVFYFASVPPGRSRDEMHRLVVEYGGAFSMNLTHDVTHSVAADRQGYKYQAAIRHGDVVHSQWLLDCVARTSLLPLKPKYQLHLSEATRRKLREEMDEFGDGYFEAVDDDDLRQVFASMDVSKLPVMDAQLAHYRTKDCATATWCLFQACHVFFAPPLHSTNPDSQALATLTLRRLSLELAMHGGSAAPALVPGVTHVVAYSLKEQPVPFGSLVSSLGERARELLSSPEVHVVAHDWLEDSCQARKQAPVAAYELRRREDIVRSTPVSELPETSSPSSPPPPPPPPQQQEQEQQQQEAPVSDRNPGDAGPPAAGSTAQIAHLSASATIGTGTDTSGGKTRAGGAADAPASGEEQEKEAATPPRRKRTTKRQLDVARDEEVAGSSATPKRRLRLENTHRAPSGRDSSLTAGESAVLPAGIPAGNGAAKPGSAGLPVSTSGAPAGSSSGKRSSRSGSAGATGSDGPHGTSRKPRPISSRVPRKRMNVSIEDVDGAVDEDARYRVTKTNAHSSMSEDGPHDAQPPRTVLQAAAMQVIQGGGAEDDDGGSKKACAAAGDEMAAGAASLAPSPLPLVPSVVPFGNARVEGAGGGGEHPAPGSAAAGGVGPTAVKLTASGGVVGTCVEANESAAVKASEVAGHALEESDLGVKKKPKVSYRALVAQMLGE